MRTGTMFVVLLMATIFNTEAKTIKVPQDYVKIQSAIDAAVNGDTVLVAEGTYFENLVIKKKIVLGSEFIIDGDTSHIPHTILDGSNPSHQDSGSVLLILPGADSNTVICGFTIQKGKGTKYAMSIETTIMGGGIAIIASGATISRNVIKNNECKSTNTFVTGAIGILHDSTNLIGPSYWVVDRNLIVNNNSISTLPGATGDGGGALLVGKGRFTNNTVQYNSVSADFGVGGGCAIATAAGGTDIRFSNNFIAHNVASRAGGGVSCVAAIGLSQKVYFENNIIIENSGTLSGALLLNTGDYTFVNNTIGYNTGGQGARVFAERGPVSVRMLNSIIWNTTNSGEFNNPGYVTAAYCNIRNGFSGTGNINTDPMFAVNDSLYHLSSASPAIGAGTLSATVGGVSLNAPLFDFFNTTRPRESGSNPDIGAVENDRSTPLTSVKDAVDDIPMSFGLEQNYPNPFNPSTTIRYSLPSSAHVKITIRGILGKEIATLVSEEQSAGWKEVKWNATNHASGMYVVRMQSGGFVETKKLILMK